MYPAALFHQGAGLRFSSCAVGSGVRSPARCTHQMYHEGRIMVIAVLVFGSGVVVAVESD